MVYKLLNLCPFENLPRCVIEFIKILGGLGERTVIL